MLDSVSVVDFTLRVDLGFEEEQIVFNSGSTSTNFGFTQALALSCFVPVTVLNPIQNIQIGMRSPEVDNFEDISMPSVLKTF